ncbi:hypothetical protein NDQ57_20455, partial [Rossellomorea marisflavi]|nr:hypothetical protein [Rossellomorea marisflavi]
MQKTGWRYHVSNQHIPSHIHRVKCSEGLPTPMGIAGWGRPCRRAEAAHRTPHGKRVAAAERNGL